MKRFVFPLERVLAFRRQQEDLESGRLAALATERRRLEELAGQQRADSRLVRVRSASAVQLDALEVRQTFESAEGLLRASRRSLELAAQAEQNRLRQLAVVLEARRRVRLLELLRTKKRLRHGRLAGLEQEALAGELHLAKLTRRPRDI